MRCSICGTKLKKEGDICSNCYKEFQEEEELKKDVKEVFKIKRKYLIKYELIKCLWVIVIFVLCMAIFLLGKKFGEFFITFFVLALILGVWLFINKRIANATTVTFYEKKVVYRFKLGFIERVKVVKYKDFSDVAYFQTFKQKGYKLGDLCFYAKGLLGASLLSGFQIKDVENIVETTQKVKEIIETMKK